MNEFDFNNIEITDENPREENFDFNKVFSPGEAPEFDQSLLNEPIGDYGEDDDLQEPGFGVRDRSSGPTPNKGGGFKLDMPIKQQELELVGT